MSTAACVLRTGPDFSRWHVDALQQQLGPAHPLTVFTDDPGLLASQEYRTVPLMHDGVGWWSKIELFAPGIGEDLIYFDLDTIIVEPPSILTEPVLRPCMLRDFNFAGQLQSSVMVIPQRCKAAIWELWCRHPDKWMERFCWSGDQGYLQYAGVEEWVRLQDQYPGEFLSWKVDRLAGREVPPNLRAIIFHGKPRPWEVPAQQQFWRRDKKTASPI
jgi:hypothetical protein